MIAHIFCLLLTVITGTWSMQTADGQAQFETRWSSPDGHHNNDSSHTVSLADLGFANNQTPNGHVTFKQHRDAGDFVFDGWLNNGDGGGTYTFTQNAAFFNELKRRGYDVNDEEGKMMTAATLDITMAYVNSIEALGYRGDFNHLVTFRALNITSQYVSEMKNAGIGDLSENEIVSLKALKVDQKYVSELASVGFSHLSARDLVTMKALKIDSAYIKYLAGHGFRNLTVHQVVEMKAERI